MKSALYESLGDRRLEHLRSSRDGGWRKMERANRTRGVGLKQYSSTLNRFLGGETTKRKPGGGFWEEGAGLTGVGAGDP